MKHKDDVNQYKLDQAERQKKKDCSPTDNQNVTGWEKHRSQGKGDKNRIRGWYNEEISERLKQIFGKKGKQEKKTSKQEEDTGKQTGHDSKPDSKD